MKSRVALDHLQSLDLDAMENEAVNWGWYYDGKPKAESVREDLAIIEQDLEILEIIRNKSVDIEYIRLCMDVENGLRKMYNYSVTNPNDELTEEEYETIVGWLKNE